MDIERWLRELRSAGEVVDIQVGGTSASALAEHADAIASSRPSTEVRFVPGYDQWVLGPGTADADVIAPERRNLATRGAALVLWGGRVRATWRRTRETVEVQWFGPSRTAPLDDITHAAQWLLGDSTPVTITSADGDD